METKKIVVVDGCTLNPGDLSWEPLQALGDCTIHDRSRPEEVLPRAENAEIVLTNKVVLSHDIIDSLPKLQYIGVLATGYNIVDIDAARNRNIPVTNIPTYGTLSVAQMVFAHLLNLTQRASDHSRAVVDQRWANAKDFCFWDYPLIELDGLTMGIVGLGQIGQATARLANAFGMRVIASSQSEITGSDTITPVSLDTLFQESDVVSLHCPLTAETEKMVNGERLEQMKSTAFLINTSRGPLIDELALAEALTAGKIAGAGLDVLATEPPPADHPLVGVENCIITPHIAWATRSARSRLLATAVENLAAFLSGEPRNVVW
ncbi:MAG: glycerate dehydrogenase [Planctomycetaceae bacterium]|nr:glycerate dehydrogenase [Planctomycetaceae bacterium]HCK42114.1 glycerate dehydrogenase [Planctomycetaceae bacterium]